MSVVKIKWRYDDLVHAAPDLYEALESMLTFYGMDEEPGEVSGVVHKQARAALAKARGEPDELPH